MKIIFKIMLGLLTFLIITIILASCAFRNPISVAPDASYTFSNQAVETSASLDIHMSILVTAIAKAPEAAVFEGGSWFKTRKLGYSAILVCHPQALLMFDTGLGQNIDVQFKDMPFFLKPLLAYGVPTPAIEQLDQDTFCPGRSLRIVLSHLHWDHASGIEDFTNTPVWTLQSELESGFDLENSSGYLVSQFDDPEINWHSLQFNDVRHMNYDQSLNLFNDGSVILVPMKGHTEGSVGMFVNLGPHRYFFTGDTTWGLEGFTRPAHKFSVMRAFADGDVDETEEEIRRVNALMKYDSDLKIIPAHDYNAYIQEAIYPGFVTAQ